ncbi:hypothetical protein PF002_g23287 [Phytophthora fragariae]|uniref:Uncharacterized protein n=1 Tax=Phytophthora fragariae TaxID=53985 RepID=A0A6A3XBA7_9STRA|nr:hypothetical protein PF007_g11394 [Phytophthora fragariae]KAE9195560.1 hypothetical protein PF002_g23287 [Phytophthora fragariae]
MAGRHSIFSHLKIRRLGHTRCHWNGILSTIAEVEERGVTVKEDDGTISTLVKKKAGRNRSASTEALQNKRPSSNSPRLSVQVENPRDQVMQMAPTPFVLQAAWHDANSDRNIRV